VLRNGTVQAGQNFSVVRNGDGDYTINIVPGVVSGFALPVVTVFDNATRNRVTPLIQRVGGNLFDVTFLDSAGTAIDTQFNFVVLGAPAPAAATSASSKSSVSESSSAPTEAQVLVTPR
jgi:hypothetical protein